MKQSTHRSIVWWATWNPKSKWNSLTPSLTWLAESMMCGGAHISISDILQWSPHTSTNPLTQPLSSSSSTLITDNFMKLDPWDKANHSTTIWSNPPPRHILIQLHVEMVIISITMLRIKEFCIYVQVEKTKHFFSILTSMPFTADIFVLHHQAVAPKKRHWDCGAMPRNGLKKSCPQMAMISLSLVNGQ